MNNEKLPTSLKELGEACKKPTKNKTFKRWRINEIFDEETIELLNNLVKATERNRPIFLDTVGDIDEVIDKDGILVNAIIEPSEIPETIVGYNYVVKIKNVLVCFEHDGWTLFAIGD